MKLDLDAIEARARAATPGPWQYGNKDGGYGQDKIYALRRGLIAIGVGDSGEAEDTVKHIAGTDPQTTLALVARAREADRLEAVVEDYEQVLKSKRDNTRALDVAMHGEEGAAKQASICDLIPLAERLHSRAEAAEAEVSRLRAVVEKLRDGLKPFGAVSVSRIFPDSTWTHCETYPLERDDGLPGGRTQALWIDGMPVSVFRTAARLLAETAPETAQSREASE